MRANRQRRLVASATATCAAVVFVLSGCSSSGGASSSGTPSSSSPGGASTASSSTGSADLGLKQPGTLNLAADFTASPNQFINNGKMDGLDVALCQAMADKMGLKISWTNLAFDALIPGLQAHRYDALCTAVFITKAREQVMNMVPYVKWGDTMAVKKSDAAKYACSGASPCFDKFAGKTVATEAGGAEVTELDAANKNVSPKMKILSFDSNVQIYQAIQNGSVDAIFVNDPQFAYFNRTNGQNAYSAVFTGVGANQLALTTLKGNNALAQAFVTALTAMKADGTYDRILKTWGVEPVDSFAMNPTPSSS